jgi:transposase-like protein
VQEPGRAVTKDYARRLSGIAPGGAEKLNEHRRGTRTKILSSKYLNNLIEQDHRSSKLRLGPMLGLKRVRSASITIAGIELINRVRKGQFKPGGLRIKDNRAPEIWNAVLAA